jgi:segregation and condensation protein B
LPHFAHARYNALVKQNGKNVESEPDQPLALESFREAGAEEGLSLDQLSHAFAAMFASGDDPYSSPAEADADPILSEANDALDVGAEGARRAAADAACEISPRTILEAMLFVGTPDNRPLAAQQVAAMMRGVRPAEIDELVRDLNDGYLKAGCPYSIVAEGVGYRMVVRSDFAAIGERLYNRVRTARLSPAAVEVLAAVAYSEPLTGEQVAQMRGVASGSILAQLVRRQLLRLERPENRSERARYFVTPRFLSLFGLTSLEDLPRSEDLNH